MNHCVNVRFLHFVYSSNNPIANSSRSVHRGFVGVMCQEVFIDPDFADDVSVMAEMLEVLILALALMNDESSALGLEINWNKTKIQASDRWRPT